MTGVSRRGFLRGVFAAAAIAAGTSTQLIPKKSGIEAFNASVSDVPITPARDWPYSIPVYINEFASEPICSPVRSQFVSARDIAWHKGYEKMNRDLSASIEEELWRVPRS